MEGMEEVEEDADKGDLLVLRRTLRSLMGAKISKERTSSTKGIWSKVRFIHLPSIVGVVQMLHPQTW